MTTQLPRSVIVVALCLVAAGCSTQKIARDATKGMLQASDTKATHKAEVDLVAGTMDDPRVKSAMADVAKQSVTASVNAVDPGVVRSKMTTALGLPPSSTSNGSTDGTTTSDPGAHSALSSVPRTIASEMVWGVKDGLTDADRQQIAVTLHNMGNGIGEGMADGLTHGVQVPSGWTKAIAVALMGLFALGFSGLVLMWRQQQLVMRSLLAINGSERDAPAARNAMPNRIPRTSRPSIA